MRILLIGLLTCSCAFAQETLIVTNAAYHASGSPVAPGSLIVLDYFNAAPGSGSTPQITGVRLQPQGSNQTFNAQLVNPDVYYTLAVIPDTMPAGPATVTLLFQGGATISAPVTVAAVAVGVFSVPGGGIGPAAAQNDELGSQPSLNQLTNPALPGHYVTLWATGLGSLTTPDVSVSISGVTVPASFAGPAPGIVGVNQINVQLPPNLTTGCYTPLSVKASNSVSNTVTIATSTGGPCNHPLGLTVDQMKALDSGPGIRLGMIRFYANVLPSQPGVGGSYTRSESIQASFDFENAISVFLSSHSLDEGPACQLGNPLVFFGELSTAVRPPAGAPLTATNAAGNALSLTADSFGHYSTQLTAAPPAATSAQLPPPLLSSGPWQITAPGGPLIGSFQKTYVLPPQMRWINRESLSMISRATDVSIVWNPQGYSASDVVSVLLSIGSDVIGSAAVSCTAPATAGQLTIPAALLRQMPPSSETQPGHLELGVLPKSPTIFDIPVVGSVDAPLLLKYYFSDSRTVTVQ
jgi:uncharacterized protein (TIGR03437 family)